MPHLARGTRSWVLTPLLLAGLLFLATLVVPRAWVAGVALVVLALALAWFFRDPHREVGEGVVAAADGRIQAVDEVEGRVRIVTFMNLHDVHVNRAPLPGVVARVTTHRGGRVPAFRKESERNERVVIDLDTDAGPVRIVQIAGAVARRIVPYVYPGQELRKGDRLGIIRLGSRVDLHLPPGLQPTVRPGDRVRAAESTLARKVDP